jgi:16S rRNA (uracil1498-N3)-methyltransferase
MPRDRFFVSGARAPGERVALEPDDARKLITVLRRQPGDAVHVVDGAGAGFTARLAIDGKAAFAILERPLERAAAETAGRIVLAQAIPKGQKMDYIVEKATELGVWAIVPLRSDRVAGDRTGEEKRERWQRIAKSAAQQAGRSRIPEVENVLGWPELRSTFERYDRVYVPWEGAEIRPLRETFEPRAAHPGSALIVIGPEGGFAAAEIAAAQAAGAVPISLGPRILRTETAALAVVACLLYARGEM